MKLQKIKHLSVMFNVGSGFCTHCNRYRYMKEEITSECQGEIWVDYLQIVCMTCGKTNNQLMED